jgi:hypothetical protein
MRLQHDLEERSPTKVLIPTEEQMSGASVTLPSVIGNIKEQKFLRQKTCVI